MKWSSGQEYKGQWLKDKFNGEGQMTWANGDTY